jgi:UDP-N-acetylglucosamine transferase subunit ALG13
LLLATSGGHLQELFHLRPRLSGIDLSDSFWVTYDTPQSRSLLKGEEVAYVRSARDRDLRTVLRNMPAAANLLRANNVAAIVTTGAQIALSFAPVAAARRIPLHFIESAARGTGPSLSGKLVARLPKVVYYTQYPSLVSETVFYRGSVMDAFASTAGEPPSALRRIVVALGTMDYGFRRLLERALNVIPSDAEVLWQTGEADVTDLPIRARPYLPSDELTAAMRQADVVLAHAGIGTILAALGEHKCPVVVPRVARHNENIDDHQIPSADAFARRGLVISRDVEELTVTDLYAAAGIRVDPHPAPPTFELVSPLRRPSRTR